MTSHDVRDMLDLPSEAAPRPAKKQKLAAPRPVLKGLAREVQNLSGDNPIAIVPEPTVFKKRRFGSRKPAAKWELKSFKNTARDDETLILRHWKRAAEVPPASVRNDDTSEQPEPQPQPEIEDSTFSKYNVKVPTPEYTDEQYEMHLKSENWTRGETDYLMGLAKDYDLRWPVIWDRYEYHPSIQSVGAEVNEGAMVPISESRSVEDLKSRYYKVAAAMMKIQKPVEHMRQAEYNLMELMNNFNPAQEAARKKFAEAAFSRTKEEAREEESLLVELKRILARADKVSEERRELYARLEAPPSTGNIAIYTSSQGLQQLLQQLMTADKSKKRKSLLGPDGTITAAGPSGLNQQASFDRRDSSVRESISGPSGTNSKKGPAQGPAERRQLTDEEDILYGVTRMDRFPSSGPAYRSERIQKPISSKSTIQQQKIISVLTELGIPQRPTMPTASVGKSFEELLQNIALLLDSRKIADKLQGEINTQKAVKEERERRQRAERGEAEPEGEAGENGVKLEDEGRGSAAPSNAGVSVHKRSASVLSAVSDKSAKRQKK